VNRETRSAQRTRCIGRRGRVMGDVLMAPLACLLGCAVGSFHDRARSASPSPVPDRVEARSFVLLDDAGHERAALRTNGPDTEFVLFNQKAPDAKGVVIRCSETHTSIWLQGSGEQGRVCLDIDSYNPASMSLYGTAAPTENPGVSLEAARDLGSIALLRRPQTASRGGRQRPVAGIFSS
jgi:hypothetical protein